MAMMAKNEPPKIWVIWEEEFCSRLNSGGGVRALAVDGKITSKEEEVMYFGGKYNIPKIMVREFVSFYSGAFRPTGNLERHELDRETCFSQMVPLDKQYVN